MSQYKPEPWVSKKGADGYYHITKGTTSLASFVLPNNAKRIVQCVNACAGIEDPAAYIADLKTENEILQKAFDEISNEFLGQKGFEKLSNYIGQVMKLKGATR